MNERLWSPAMRKWANDAHRHGIQIGFAKTRPSRKDYAGWGAGLPNLVRMTDDGNVRVIDGLPIGSYGGTRKIDRVPLQ